MMRAADATAQLVQLREAEMLGAIDQNRVGARYVDAGLDDRGADQDVEALVIEVEHHLFEFALAHLAVRKTHASRSEEHTSELQSLMRISYAVFCLKKKKDSSTSRTP